jgi:hypothetical protein
LINGIRPISILKWKLLGATRLKDFGKMTVLILPTWRTAEKIAFAGNKKWLEWAAKATDFFRGSGAKYFELKNIDKAMTWITV